MANERRRQRLQSLLVEIISELLQREIKDPRLGFASVTRVELSGDLRHAKVYVSVLGSDEESEQTRRLLGRAKGFLRSELAQRLHIRFVPDIDFRIDRGIEQGARVLDLLRKLEIPPATDA